MQYQPHNTTKGFLLIEILVALSIFSVVMLISTGTLLTLVDANHKARSLKSVVDNLNFALENMSRNIRVGNIYHCTTTSNPDLLTGLDAPRDCTAGNFFALQAGNGTGRIEYWFNDSTNRLQRRLVPIAGPSTNFIDVTAAEVDIEKFEFTVENTSTSDNLQPFVHFIIQGKVSQRGIDTAFNLQTAVTQRLLDL